VAEVLPFWVVPDAIWMWKNIVKHCRRILDNFPASLFANYISGNNFTVYWAVIVCCRCIAILGGPKGNPGMVKLSKPLPVHFG